MCIRDRVSTQSTWGENKKMLQNLHDIFSSVYNVRKEDPYFPVFIQCVSTSVAVLRRLGLSERRRKDVAGMYLPILYEVLVLYEDELNNAKEEFAFMFKELNGLLGNLSLDERICLDVLNKAFLTYILRISLEYFDNPKIIKTTLGCLINMTATMKARDSLAKEKDFYILLFNILEKYDYSKFVIDYAIKLMANTSQNEICIKNYTTKSCVKMICKVFFKLDKDEYISMMLLKIFKTICIKGNATEVFIDVVNEINKSAASCNLIEDMITLVKLVAKDIEKVVECLLFISLLAQKSEDIQKMIREAESFGPLIKDLMFIHKDDEEGMKLLYNSIAFLPMEDLNFLQRRRETDRDCEKIK
eukprot:TRINITY_DN1218_c0_g1_i10.p1 TRINITY_DN1218_c0_g1~~TRINITY_DN1218_c0_g1_i10.p1  ORF type:complete len:388 (-),score=145.19 TRINITY_DN1218_c0_g1_i10:99-1175(-)